MKASESDAQHDGQYVSVRGPGHVVISGGASCPAVAAYAAAMLADGDFTTAEVTA